MFYRYEYTSAKTQRRVEIIHSMAGLGKCSIPTLIELAVLEEGTGEVWTALYTKIDSFGAKSLPQLFYLLEFPDPKVRESGLVLLNIMGLRKYRVSKEQRELLKRIARVTDQNTQGLELGDVGENSIIIAMELLGELKVIDEEVGEILLHNYQYDLFSGSSLSAIKELGQKAQYCQGPLIKALRGETKYSRYCGLLFTLVNIMSERDFQNLVLKELESDRPDKFRAMAVGSLDGAKGLITPLLFGAARIFVSPKRDSEKRVRFRIKLHFISLGTHERRFIHELPKLSDSDQSLLLSFLVGNKMGLQESNKSLLKTQRDAVRSKKNKALIDQWLLLMPKVKRV